MSRHRMTWRFPPADGSGKCRCWRWDDSAHFRWWKNVEKMLLTSETIDDWTIEQLLSQKLKLTIPQFFWYWQMHQVNARILTPSTARWVDWNQTGDYFNIKQFFKRLVYFYFSRCYYWFDSLAIRLQSKDLKTPYPKNRTTRITGLAYIYINFYNMQHKIALPGWRHACSFKNSGVGHLGLVAWWEDGDD